MTEGDFIPPAPLLRDALALARQMGCLVEFFDGEVRVTCQGVGKVIANARKKDASRRLVCLLRKVQKARKEGRA